MKVLAVIPARGGSKDIKNKNLLKIDNKSLVSIAISKAKKSKYISKIALTSDDEKILKEGKKSDLEYCIKRPNKYATDKASIFKTIKHTVEWFDKNHNWCPDIIAIILPTTPLRPLWHIETCLKNMMCQRHDTLVIRQCPFGKTLQAQSSGWSLCTLPLKPSKPRGLCICTFHFVRVCALTAVATPRSLETMIKSNPMWT